MKRSNDIENRIHQLLKNRNRIHRKITTGQKWSWKTVVKNRIKLLGLVKTPLVLVQTDAKNYNYLGRKISSFVEKENILSKTCSVEIPSVFNQNDYPAWFNIIREFDVRLRSMNAFLVIQGSYADGMITSYSDVDLVLFYKVFNEEIEQVKKEIERFILEVDPLQHHGVFAIDQKSFSCYWQMSLPVEVLAKAKCFTDTPILLKISHVINENYSADVALRNSLLGIESFLKRDYQQIGLWEWKFFLSNLMLCPTLLLAVRGRYVYKKESFETVRAFYGEKAWYVIERSSEIRRDWVSAEKLNTYKKHRNSVAEPPELEFIRAVEIPAISVDKDEKFFKGLQLFVNETRRVLHD